LQKIRESEIKIDGELLPPSVFVRYGTGRNVPLIIASHALNFSYSVPPSVFVRFQEAAYAYIHGHASVRRKQLLHVGEKENGERTTLGPDLTFTGK
jgi:hypothetical protein